ncbi:hypothetical protein AGMMS50293_28030 [Spirochaetia bacterium]|nr:hypothetical protein AGMMS50293_28030 [Spirochaetia bacterium]
MQRVIFALCALFAISGPLRLFATATTAEAATAETATPVMELLEAWSLVDTALIERAPEQQVLVSAIANFRQSLEEFISTPLYAEYEGKSLIESRVDILTLVDGLSAAVEAGKAEETARDASIIREKLIAWQRMELRISGQALLRLLRFFTVFILISCGLILLIERLRRALLRSRIQEQDSAAFSRMILLAQETERSRIAGELHDTVLQDMGRLLRATGEFLAPPVAGSGELLDLQRRIMETTRAICLDLMPPDFSHLALPDALTRLCMDFTRRTGVECRSVILPDFSAEGFPPESQLQIYRIAQEALMNIEKHAHATEVTLTARNKTSRSSILLCISDDGRGLPAHISPGRLGLRGMRKRAAILGADLSFVDGPGSGLTVRLEIP